MDWKRLAFLTGAVFAVLAAIAAVLVNEYSYLPSSAEVQALFTDNATRLQVAGYIGALSAAFLLWFAGRQSSALRRYEGGSGHLSSVALGSGVAAGAMIGLAFALLIAGAARGGSDGGIDAGGATTLYDIYGNIFGVALPMAFAVFIGAVTVVTTKVGMWPAWLTWISVLLVIGSLSPLGWFFVGIDLLWFVVISIGTYVRSEPSTSPPA